MELAMIDKCNIYELTGKLIVIFLAGLLFFLISCKTSVRYVPVETVSIDSVRLSAERIDSIFVHDSTSVIFNGDSVIEYKYRYIYKYKGSTDTVYINKADTIRVPYPVEIEKKMTTWQRLKVDFGGFAFGIIIVTILIIFGRNVYHLRK